MLSRFGMSWARVITRGTNELSESEGRMHEGASPVGLTFRYYAYKFGCAHQIRFFNPLLFFFEQNVFKLS